MKNLNKILSVAVAAGALSITAAMANEPALSPHAKANQPHYATPGSSLNSTDVVIEHPIGNAKAREQMHRTKTEPLAAVVSPAPMASAGYHATGADGITASPRLRQQLDERAVQPVMIAPLK